MGPQMWLSQGGSASRAKPLMASQLAAYWVVSFFQAEQQLVDCAQDFNNHGCQGYVPDQEGPKTSSFPTDRFNRIQCVLAVPQI